MEFGRFMDENPTVFHFVKATAEKLRSNGYIEITPETASKIRRGGSYFIRRDDSNIIAFDVGSDFIPGTDSLAIVGTHIDANSVRLKPTSTKKPALGYTLLGAAPYAGGLGPTWWDRDLGIGGRVLVQNGNEIESCTVRVPGIIGSIPSLAPHFGSISLQNNKETNMVPVVATLPSAPPKPEEKGPLVGKHNIGLIRAVAKELKVSIDQILAWDLEFFSAEKARIGGLDNSLLYCSRMDDRLCAFTSIEGLLQAPTTPHAIRIAALYNHEEIGSLSATGAKGNLLNVVFDLIFEALGATKDEKYASLANSFIASADVTHAGNPNYTSAYLQDHTPLLNTGMTIKRGGRFTSDGICHAICSQVSEYSGVPLQVFHPRNDTATGGTIGPMISASTGIRTADIGIPILSMHSIREVTGTKDIELGIRWFKWLYAIAERLSDFDL